MKSISRSSLAVATIAVTAALSAGSAHAFVIGSDADVGFASSSVSFGYQDGSFTLFDTSDGPVALNEVQSFSVANASYGHFGHSPVSISTSGTAKVNSITLFGYAIPVGYPAFVSGKLLFDGSLEYTKFPTPTGIVAFPGPTFIGLRVKGPDGVHYGYAEFDGALLQAFAFESVAGVGILAGAPIVAAIPEPSELALLSLGLVGLAALRRRRKPKIDSRPAHDD